MRFPAPSFQLILFCPASSSTIAHPIALSLSAPTVVDWDVPSVNVPFVHLISPATSSFAHGVGVQIPTFPLFKIRILSVPLAQ